MLNPSVDFYSNWKCVDREFLSPASICKFSPFLSLSASRIQIRSIVGLFLYLRHVAPEFRPKHRGPRHFLQCQEVSSVWGAHHYTGARGDCFRNRETLQRNINWKFQNIFSLWSILSRAMFRNFFVCWSTLTQFLIFHSYFTMPKKHWPYKVNNNLSISKHVLSMNR